ncbi:hypothetical protein E4K67_17960 [Desulfosporosinus fructosivorans]|uniref:Uncharacterized protein n=1 Tax=Desulfosporosinus fructosivorans TaxID=2018669 RepID=A0A4Z0R2I7_9FIRM|nr:hypothetical protein [Desulfosporosinus fructosivorans]TGE36980.1 hypothetical protein E4K67_17960 [Desulfosporosinus fructosivorans]
MSGSQPGKFSEEPLNMGFSIFAPISTEAGSASLLFAQPLLTGSVFASTAVLIVSELFLFIARRIFDLKSIPVLDARNGQRVEMSLTDLQAFLRWMANGIGTSTSPNSTPVTDGGKINLLANQTRQSSGTDSTGFITVELPEAPLTIALYFSAFYSNNPYTPSVSLYIPILAFPGIRGAIPLLILGLLSTIFVRSVVSPQSSGSKPLSTPETSINTPLDYSPNDLLQLLTKFGKKFGTK